MPEYSAPMAAIDEVEAYLASMPGLNARRLAHAEWGIVVPGDNVGGEPIEASVRIADRLLRIQALALDAASDLDPWMLLWWNRQTRLVRFGCSQARDIWVHGDIPIVAVDEAGIDRLLGLITEAVAGVRNHAARVRGRRSRRRRLGRGLQPVGERLVVLAVRAHVGGERRVAAGLPAATGLLERAPQAEVRVVVHGVALDHRGELLRGLVEAP